MSEDAMEYFPSWRYHRDKKPVMVKNAEEDEALGPGWEDSPAKFPDKEVAQAEIRRRHWKGFEAAVNNPAEQVRLYIEYSTMHPAMAAADSRYKETAPLIPVLQTQAALERQVEDREKHVTETETTEAPAANKRLDSTRVAVETIESHAVASPAPPQARVAGTRKGAAPTDNLIPVAGSSEERAETVARIIAELNTLEPQMYGDESYEKLKEDHPDFLTFAVSEQRNDLKVLLVNIQASTRHIRLAQQCAAHYHGRRLVTIKDDWKYHKPENFRSKKARKSRSKI